VDIFVQKIQLLVIRLRSSSVLSDTTAVLILCQRARQEHTMTCEEHIHKTTANLAKLVDTVMADEVGQPPENLALEDISVPAKACQIHRDVHQALTIPDEEQNLQALAFPALPVISARIPSIQIGKFMAAQPMEVLETLLLVEQEPIKNVEDSLRAISAQLVKCVRQLE
jgi:hypothetical protein